MSNNKGNTIENPVSSEPRLGNGNSIMRTPMGNVFYPNNGSVIPPLPPPPQINQAITNTNYGLGYRNYSNPYYNGYNMGMGMGMNSYYSYPGSYSGYSNYGSYTNRYSNQNDPENIFIQLAEENSRSAFQSIEALVGAFGNIASMLDSTYFAITSLFRAIMGVVANFSRLRGVFAQLVSTFAILRSLNWMYRKILYLLRISNIDPSTTDFKEAFVAATQGNYSDDNQLPQKQKQTPWPILIFLGFILTAPYIVMKIFGTMSKTAIENSRNPETWINPIITYVLYDFQSRNLSELTVKAGQTIRIAPKEIQATNKLLSTGWALATIDNRSSGLIPISYIQRPNQVNKMHEQEHSLLNNLTTLPTAHSTNSVIDNTIDKNN